MSCFIWLRGATRRLSRQNEEAPNPIIPEIAAVVAEATNASHTELTVSEGAAAVEASGEGHTPIIPAVVAEASNASHTELTVSEEEANIPDMAAVEASGESHTDAKVQLPDVSALLAQLAAAKAEIKRVEGVAAANGKRANDNEKITERLDKRLRGSFWLITDSFSLSSKKMSSAQEYETVVNVERQSLFKAFVPPLDWLRMNRMTHDVKEKIRRYAPEFSHGPWGEEISAGGAQRAHLVPFSFRCCMEWICIFIPFVFIAALSNDEREMLCHCMVLGLYATKRFRFSGFLHSPVNFFPLRCQEKTLDLNPSIMFFPILSLRDILFWNGEPYHCLIIGSSYDTMMMAGFHYVLPKPGQTLADSDSFCELEAKHSDVAKAFESFKSLLLIVVPYLASQSIKTLETFKAFLCSFFRAFVVTQQNFPCPEVPENCDAYVMCLKFHKRQIKKPSFSGQVSGDCAWSGEAEGGAGDHNGLLPHPFLLFLRSLNAWCNFLHSKGQWGAWNTYLAGKDPVQISGVTRTLDSSVPLVLLPSCRDVEIDGGDCIFCKAADVCENPDLYPQLCDELLQAAQGILDQTTRVTEEDAGKILGLQRGVRVGGDSAATGAGAPAAASGSRDSAAASAAE